MFLIIDLMRSVEQFKTIFPLLDDKCTTAIENWIQKSRITDNNKYSNPIHLQTPY